MSDTPQTDNKLASAVASVLKDLIESAAEDVAVTAIVTDYPWVPKPIAQYFVGLAAKYMYRGAAEVSTRIIIDMQTDQENADVKQAMAALKDAIAKGDQGEIAAQSYRVHNAWARLIHWDGSVSV